MTKFSSRLRELRGTQKISQEALGNILGVTQQAVGKWERDIASPDPETIVKMAVHFGVTTDYLLGVSDTPYYTAEAQASDGKPVRGYSTTNKAPLTPKEVEAVERIEADPEAAGVVKVPLSELLAQEDWPEALRKVLEDIAREAVKQELDKREDKKIDG